MYQSLTRRNFLKTSMLGGAAAFGAPGVASLAQALDASRGLAAAKPNLDFMLSDQHAWDMTGSNGNTQVKTPRLDQLAAQGANFRHCISNCPVCTPSRGTLLSGLHPLYHGAFANDVQMLPGNANYFGQVLRDQGYKTAYVGKWHLQGGDRDRPIAHGPLRYGFDETFLSNNCALDFRPGHAYYWDDLGHRVTFDKWEVDGQTDQGLAFLDSCTPDQPFALFISWHPPHDMGVRDGDYYYDTETDLMALYDPDTIQPRASVANTTETRRKYHGYMAMISGVDRAVGNLLDKLEQRGLAQNTLVAYTADHGDLLGSHGRPKPKGYAEQESCRIPLIMRFPQRIAPAQQSDQLIGLLDMMPTLLGLMELPVPGTCQGRNRAAALLSGVDDGSESLPRFFFMQGWRGVYTRDITYSFDETTGPFSPTTNRVLYDRRNDPAELVNLFDQAQSAALQEHMHQLSVQWLTEFNDPCPTTAALFARCGVVPAQLGLPNTEAILAGRPIDLIQGGELESFLPAFTQASQSWNRFHLNL